MIDSYADTLVNIFLDCAHSSIPSISSTKIQVGTTVLMNSEEKRTSGTKCGKRLGACPSSGLLFNIKKNAKSRYKYAVRRIKCRQNHR